MLTSLKFTAWEQLSRELLGDQINKLVWVQGSERVQYLTYHEFFNKVQCGGLAQATLRLRGPLCDSIKEINAT